MPQLNPQNEAIFDPSNIDEDCQIKTGKIPTDDDAFIDKKSQRLQRWRFMKIMFMLAE